MKTKREQLVRLPNGSWVRPILVTEISVSDSFTSPAIEMSHGPEVYIYMPFHAKTVKFDTLKEAQTWADGFAGVCNRKRK